MQDKAKLNAFWARWGAVVEGFRGELEKFASDAVDAGEFGIAGEAMVMREMVKRHETAALARVAFVTENMPKPVAAGTQLTIGEAKPKGKGGRKPKVSPGAETVAPPPNTNGAPSVS